MINIGASRQSHSVPGQEENVNVIRYEDIKMMIITRQLSSRLLNINWYGMPGFNGISE